MPVLRVPSPSPYASVIGFCSAVRAGDWVVVAGTSAVGAGGVLVGAGDAYAQTREVVRKIAVALADAGADLTQVVQTRVYLARQQDWQEVARAHGEAFAAHPPAAAFLVVGLLDPAMLVEIEAVAYTGP